MTTREWIARVESMPSLLMSAHAFPYYPYFAFIMGSAAGALYLSYVLWQYDQHGARLSSFAVGEHAVLSRGEMINARNRVQALGILTQHYDSQSGAYWLVSLEHLADAIARFYCGKEDPCPGLPSTLEQITVRNAMASQYDRSYRQLCQMYGHWCAQCHDTDALQIDHIRAISRGGTNDFGNLQFLCKACNTRKGAA